jgi:hypothetical protein
MTPEHGPRRPFAHQQLNPNFAPPSYTEGAGGRMEKKIEDIVLKIKKFFARK